jgi:CxxC motif-containing protein (DUF1111 family)
MRWTVIAASAAILFASLGAGAGNAPLLDDAARMGGAATVADTSEAAYRRPVPTLDAGQRKRFEAGRELFDARWVIFWFEQGEWGAGPTFNAMGCGECHVRNGRGAPLAGGDGPHQMIVRLSLPGTSNSGGPVPHPGYGDQLQTRGVKGVVPEEGRVEVTWIEAPVAFADGDTAALRRPEIAIRDLKFGPLEPSVMTSLRAAPALVGMGLLDAVPERVIAAPAEGESVDGIRGRPNTVWDFAARRSALGRFGHKATHTTLRQQIAAAFSADIGVSSDYFPEQNCPGPQGACRDLMPAGKPELGQVRWAAVETFLRANAVPARRDPDDPVVRAGERLFAASRCAICHRPALETGEVPGFPSLSGQVIHPYTDLLLHDLGEGLADHRPDFQASGREWRTPPLWGIGLTATVNGMATYLHDGRARTLAEAILWHGGEAQGSRDAFRAMSKADREALLRFLGSL